MDIQNLCWFYVTLDLWILYPCNGKWEMRYDFIGFLGSQRTFLKELFWESKDLTRPWLIHTTQTRRPDMLLVNLNATIQFNSIYLSVVQFTLLQNKWDKARMAYWERGWYSGKEKGPVQWHLFCWCGPVSLLDETDIQSKVSGGGRGWLSEPVL